jgi:hypothetical protein
LISQKTPFFIYVVVQEMMRNRKKIHVGKVEEKNQDVTADASGTLM